MRRHFIVLRGSDPATSSGPDRQVDCDELRLVGALVAIATGAAQGFGLCRTMDSGLRTKYNLQNLTGRTTCTAFPGIKSAWFRRC
jgi:hypothetical protein